MYTHPDNATKLDRDRHRDLRADIGAHRLARQFRDQATAARRAQIALHRMPRAWRPVLRLRTRAHTWQHHRPGRILLPEARRTLDAAASAQAAVLSAREGLRGRLRLGLMQVVGLVDIGPLIARFHRDRPLVDIQPRAATGGSVSLVADVRRGILDAALVGVGNTDHPGLTSTMLATEPVLLACPPDHPLARRSAVSVSELAGEPLVDFAAGWGTRTMVDQLFATAGVERSVGIEVPDASIHAALVGAGLGLGILPESMVAIAGLTGVPLRPAMTFGVAFVVPSDRPLSPVTKAFADLVAATYGEPL